MLQMATAKKIVKIRRDIIPYRAGLVMVTPLDANKKPNYTKSVATEWNFLTSTQTSVSRETEELANGNGSDKEYTNSETYNLTVIGNTFDPDFHAAVTGRVESVPEKALALEQFNFSLPEAGAGTLQITFGTGKDYEILPAADADGNYNFIIEDSFGNRLMRSTTTSVGTYVYDADNKALQFSNDYAGANIRVLFWYESADALVYNSNPTLQQPEYQIDVYGISMSAETDEKYKIMTRILRATISGDVSDQTTQKSKSAPVTYTFKSAPVPEGVSVYSQTYVPLTVQSTAPPTPPVTNPPSGNEGTE